MSDVVIISRDDLTEALTEFRLGVRLDNGDHEGATVSEPDVVADVIMRTLSTRFAAKLQGPPVILPAAPPGDRELHAMAVIADMLTGLDNPDAASRILRYFNDRYGDGDD